MPEQFGEKQHEATPFRRQKAREQGQVARSQDLSSALLLLAAVGVLCLFGARVANYLANFTIDQFAAASQPGFGRDDFVALWWSAGLGTALVIVPIFGALFVTAILSHVIQFGFLFVPQKLGFDFSRVNPLRGFQRIFSLTGAVRLGLGICKVACVAAIAYSTVWDYRQTILSLASMQAAGIARFMLEIGFWVCLKVGVVLLILAVIDFFYQRWKHEQDLRMTNQEMREELKTLQGDPQVAARRRAIQRQLAMNRIGSAVPQADVVVTNPTELAIAIQYDHESMDAPVVLAKGAGTVAQRIRRLALENNVPVVERKELARALYKQVEPGKPIPPEEYAAMAEVLKYVYQLKGRTLPGLRSAA